MRNLELLSYLRSGDDVGGGVKKRGEEEDEDAAAAADFRAKLRHAVGLLVTTLKVFTLEQIALTFNGGKDACVVFFLARAALAQVLEEEKGYPADEEALRQALCRLNMLYFEPKHEFPEIVEFMQEVASR